MAVPTLPEHPTPSKKVQKGAVYYYDFGQSNGSVIEDVHPCLVVSRTRPNASTTIVVPLSDVRHYTVDGTPTGKMKYPHNPRVLPTNCKGGMGMGKVGAAKCDQPQAVDVGELYAEWYIGQLDEEAIAKIELGLIYGLDLWGTFRGTLGSALDNFVEIWMRQFERR